MATLCRTTFSIALPALLAMFPFAHASSRAQTCRSYCGNLTVDYPFALKPGCGHPGFRDLLFCINDVLMLHITSGSYRVLKIDYAYGSLTLQDPDMSTCHEIVLGRRGNGFEVEPWRAAFLSPTPDNVFMLIGCSPQSPLFQGFPTKHLACRNVSGMGCEKYYGCPAWETIGHKQVGMEYGSGPPVCCALPFEVIRAINLTKLQCEGYSSAYSLAPLRAAHAREWSYGIRVKYIVEEGSAFCRACAATGGACGYGGRDSKEMCLCETWNATTNCDSSAVNSQSSSSSDKNALISPSFSANILGGIMTLMTLLMTIHLQS